MLFSGRRERPLDRYDCACENDHLIKSCVLILEMKLVYLVVNIFRKADNMLNSSQEMQNLIPLATGEEAPVL